MTGAYTLDMSAPDLSDVARRYGVSLAAVNAVMASLHASRGTAAQFNHPDLGGHGQWMPGMTQVGDMFNTALRSRVDALCSELAGLVGADTSTDTAAGTSASAERWWPASLGSPDAGGGQNDIRYAWFARSRRLAVERAGVVTLYDTGSRQITGVAQAQQSGAVGTLTFSSSEGPVDVASLPVVTD